MKTVLNLSYFVTTTLKIDIMKVHVQIERQFARIGKIISKQEYYKIHNSSLLPSQVKRTLSFNE